MVDSEDQSAVSHASLSPQMTLRLILTRHAKSSWDDPLIDDHDRPLNPRGAKAARGDRRRGLRSAATCPTRRWSRRRAHARDLEAGRRRPSTRRPSADVQPTRSTTPSPERCWQVLRERHGARGDDDRAQPRHRRISRRAWCAALPGDSPVRALSRPAATAVIDFEAPDWADGRLAHRPGRRLRLRRATWSDPSHANGRTRGAPAPAIVGQVRGSG